MDGSLSGCKSLSSTRDWIPRSDRDMGGIELSDGEEIELYVLLKPRETSLAAPLAGLLRRIERSLYQRMTIEEIEGLSGRFSG